jgi:predicted nucleotidyltransferase
MITLNSRSEPADPARRAASCRRPSRLEYALSTEELQASRFFIARILDEIPATLCQASLFGSKARGEARPDSDVDILLVFRDLPPDREPHASYAEAIAEEVADLSRVPVTVWSVALIDLEPGKRTPMLVDALADAFPIWCWPQPLPSVDFRHDDALRCCDSLLDRVAEGSQEFTLALTHGDAPHAARRARDDIVRLCTALLLLRGVTRPRRAEVVRGCLRLGLFGEVIDPVTGATLDWVCGSFGPAGRADEGPVPEPPVSHRQISALLGRLVDHVQRATSAAGIGVRQDGTPRGEAV